MIRSYLKSSNLYPKGNEAYLGVSYIEALYSNLTLEKEFESFHFETCFKCEFHNVVRPALKPVDTMTDAEILLYEEYKNILASNPDQKRKMSIHQGEFMWCYICSKCIPEKQRESKDDSLRQRVQDLLGS